MKSSHLVSFLLVISDRETKKELHSETVQKQAKEMVDFIKEATNIRHIEFNDSKALTVEQVKKLWK